MDAVSIPADAITLPEAARLIRGRRGRVPCVRSLRRWITVGVLAKGRRVHLRAVRVHGEYLTCPDWVNEFELVRVEEVIPAHEMIRSKRAESAAVAHARAVIASLAPGRR